MRTSPLSSKKQAHATALSILLSPGLLIIDHIHFQYNGFLYGILIFSIVLARQHSGLLTSGMTFAVLICMKHIYLYLAPAYFVYLLRVYCLGSRSLFDIQIGNCIKLGVSIGLVGVVAFGPFIYYEQLPQVVARLFPFSRGLCHAYWAPNIWAMYSFSDRVLIKGMILTEHSTAQHANLRSRSVPEDTSECRRCHQRYARLGRRYKFRSTARHHAADDLCLDSGSSSGLSLSI